MRNDWREVDGFLTGWVYDVRQIASEYAQFVGRPYREVADHIEDLLKRVARLEEENEILKRGGV